jgi:betaine-homocysteine S-methyltransferase
MTTNGTPGNGKPAKRGLMERLKDGPVVCAEGYLFEMERRGYLQAGPFVPEVVLEHPEIVEGLTREFVHAGSDVALAFTYYAHREKMRIIDREAEMDALNKRALDIAKKVADETGALFSGDLCNTNIYAPDDAKVADTVRGMFREQAEMAAEAGVEMVVVETFSFAQEAIIAVEEAKKAGVPVVATLAMHQPNETREGWKVGDACRRLEDAGADVVGLNCIRGPRTMLPMLCEVVEAVSCPVAALPVPYRTTEQQPSFQSLRDPAWSDFPNERPFPTALDPFTCNRYEMADFARKALDAGARYVGVCCGAGPHHIRAVAEACGRRPAASRYTADMSKHAFLGTDPRVSKVNREYAAKL